MFRTTFFPLKSERFASDKSDLTNVKSGASDPIAGNSPAVVTGFPFNVILAIYFSFNSIIC